MYVVGAADALAMDEKATWLQWCVPQGVTYDQRKAILLKYMRDNPDLRHHPTPFLYWTSLYFAYNCWERSLQRR